MERSLELGVERVPRTWDSTVRRRADGVGARKERTKSVSYARINSHEPETEGDTRRTEPRVRSSIVLCPFKLKGEEESTANAVVEKPKGHHRYKSTSAGADSRERVAEAQRGQREREEGRDREVKERRRDKRRDAHTRPSRTRHRGSASLTLLPISLLPPLAATYANAGKSIYLYLFIAFKCVFPPERAARGRRVAGADHPRKRADLAAGYEIRGVRIERPPARPLARRSFSPSHPSD